MTSENSLLCAQSCETLPAPKLTATWRVGQDAVPIFAPLGDKVSVVGPQADLQEQIATSLQMIAAIQAARYPWMAWDGLYRVIVPLDRNASVLANAHLLEAIGQPVSEHLNKKSAFAFPCQEGIVVILPLDVVRLALVPDNEDERQYGLTTIWHEFVHVHALTKQYFKDGRFQIPVNSPVSHTATQAWHEFFAERHSHWPGFDTAFERQLVDVAWESFKAEPTRETVTHLLVRLASAHGRMSVDSCGDGCLTAFPQVLDSTLLVRQWQACAEALEAACSILVTTGCAPDLWALDQSLLTLAESLVRHQL